MKYLKFVFILGSYTCFGVKLFHVSRVIFLKTFTLERKGARDMMSVLFQIYKNLITNNQSIKFIPYFFPLLTNKLRFESLEKKI